MMDTVAPAPLAQRRIVDAAASPPGYPRDLGEVAEVALDPTQGSGQTRHAWSFGRTGSCQRIERHTLAVRSTGSVASDSSSALCEVLSTGGGLSCQHAQGDGP